MTTILRQSTATILKLGPFVDDTDFKTAETGLSIAQADIQISKAGGAFAQTSDASPTTTHDADGWYPIPLTATDTGTVGTLKVQVLMTGALPVWESCQVVEEAIYDAFYAASATGLLPANVTQISGSGPAADNVESVFLGTGHTDDVDLAARQLFIQNDVGVAVSVSSTYAGAEAAMVVQATQSNVDAVALNSGAGTGRSIHANTDISIDGDMAIGGTLSAVNLYSSAGATFGASTNQVTLGVGSTNGLGWTHTLNPTCVFFHSEIAQEIEDEATDALTAFDPATATALTTAQNDLDTLTGSDGVTLATSQPNYAPATAAALTTAQNDLDTLTGSDGATLATSQPNYAPATAAALATTDAVVDNLALGIIYGTAQTGTLSTTQASTDLTGYADDQLIGRTIIFTSGNCDGEATDITDYANTNGVLTFTALTTAPGNGDTFKIV